MNLIKLTIMLTFCCIPASIAAEFKCKSSAKCICASIPSSYESQCPMFDPYISMTVSPNGNVYVQCNEYINWHTSDLPFIEVSNALLVHFRNCSFNDINFHSAMNKIGVDNTKSLRIDFTEYFHNVTLTSDHFLNLTDLERLFLSSSTIQDIDENAFSLLQKLRVLVLSYNQMPELMRPLFHNLPNLAALEISQLNLTHLSSDMLQNFNLSLISAWGNRLTVLDGDLFKNLKSLQRVEFSHNQIEEIPEELFHSLPSLTNISFASNDLKSIPRNLFSKSKTLFSVNFSRNKHLSSLPGDLFANQSQLEVVLMNDCNLTSLPEGLFEGSPSLCRIILRQNRLEQLPEDIFNGLEKLDALDLSLNKLKALPDGVFDSLRQLRSLDLEDNMLASIGERLFTSLRSLESLNLRHNRIGVVHKQAFQTMDQLKTLILSHNGLSFQDQYMDVSPFVENVNLQVVDLSYNNITSLNLDWTKLKANLERLDLSHNQINAVDLVDLSSISGKLKMDLSYNQITTIDFSFAKLVVHNIDLLETYSSTTANNVVLLNENPIDCNCFLHNFVMYLNRDMVPQVPFLVTIVADRLKCAAPEKLVGFPVQKLKTSMLTCSLDQLPSLNPCPDKCECSVRVWDRAFIVNCEDRNLTHVPTIEVSALDFINQTIVHLEGNFLEEGPSPNMGYENVTKLYLSSNNIQEVSWVPPNAKVLALDANNLTHINSKVISMLNISTLRKISLSANPWSCDCTSMDFSKFLISQLGNKDIDFNDIKCRNTGGLLISLTENDVCPIYMAVVLGVSVALALIAMIAILTAVYCCKRRKIQRWYAGPHNKSQKAPLSDKLDLITSLPATPNVTSTPPVIDMDLLAKNNPLDFRSPKV